MPEVIKKVGDIVEVSIVVDEADNFNACGFDLLYDSDYLEFLSAEEGTYLDSSGAVATVFAANIAESPPGSPQLGTLVVSMARINSYDGAQSGDGELCILQFKALKFGTTMLEFSPTARSVFGLNQIGENYELGDVNWYNSDLLRIDAKASLRILIQG